MISVLGKQYPPFQAERCEMTALTVVEKQQQFTTMSGLISTIF